MTKRRRKPVSSRLARVLSELKRPTSLAFSGFLLLACGISANALLLQPRQHPAPLFFAGGGQAASATRATMPPTPDPARFSPTEQFGTLSDVAAVQRALARAAYGPIRTDGIFGPQTRDAIARFQADHGLPATGEISEGLIVELRAAGALDE